MFWLEWISEQCTWGHALHTLKTSTESLVDCPVGQCILVRNSVWFGFYYTVDSKIWNKRKWWKFLLEFLAGSRLLLLSITAQAFWPSAHWICCLLTGLSPEMLLKYFLLFASFDWRKHWLDSTRSFVSRSWCSRRLNWKSLRCSFPFHKLLPKLNPGIFEETKWWGSGITSTYPWPSGVGPEPWVTLRQFRNKCLDDWIEASTRPMSGSRASPQLGHQKLVTGTHRSCRQAALGLPEIPVIRVPLSLPVNITQESSVHHQINAQSSCWAMNWL